MCTRDRAAVDRGGTQTARATRGDASPAEELEVLGGDRAVARADLHRRALARVRRATRGRRRRWPGRGLVTEATPGIALFSTVSVPAATLPSPPAAVAVAVKRSDRALRRHRAVLAPAAVGLADRRAELDLAVRPGRGRSGGRRAESRRTTRAAAPTPPSRRLRVQHLERLALRAARAPGSSAARRSGPACRRSRRAPRSRLLRGVRGREQRADRRGGDRVDLRRVRVGRGGAAVSGSCRRGGSAPSACGGRRAAGPRCAAGQLELDRAGAVVEAAGEVLEHARLGPLAVALRRPPSAAAGPRGRRRRRGPASSRRRPRSSSRASGSSKPR